MSKILIVEDELAINKMLCLNLGVTGYETVSLMDVMLPKVDGFALLQPLSEHHIPVIYLAARDDLESKLRGSVTVLIAALVISCSLFVRESRKALLEDALDYTLQKNALAVCAVIVLLAVGALLIRKRGKP